MANKEFLRWIGGHQCFVCIRENGLIKYLRPAKKSPATIGTPKLNATEEINPPL